MSELIKDNAVSAETTKVRYSDEELEEFRTIINDMLDKARKEYNTLRRVIMHNGSNDIEDTTPSFKTVEDDGAYQLSKEEASVPKDVNDDTLPFSSTGVPSSWSWL